MKKLIQIIVAALVIWACMEALQALHKQSRETAPPSSGNPIPNFKRMEAQ